MEEIVHRTDILPFEGLGEDAHKYLDQLLEECSEDGADVSAAIEPAALDLMAERLTTPLQFAECLIHAFEAGFQIGQKSDTQDIVSASMAPDDLEPHLTRQGYSVKILADQFQAKPTEIQCFLSGQLDTSRIRELADQMHMVGLLI